MSATMQDIIAKADVLIEALPYIQHFRDAVVVVKFGGSAMEDPEHRDGILTDVTFMECVGMLPVLVHGGGKAISREMKAQGIEPRFVKGQRVTCERSIKVVEKVIKEEINREIVDILQRQGARAEVVHGETVFRVERKTETDPQTGEIFDWGFVGEPVDVDTAPVLERLGRQCIPVITPLGMGPDGRIYNVNADIAAAAMAKALKARKLAFLSDVPGLLRDPEAADSLIATLHVDEVEYLVGKGVIGGGMLPKVESGVAALRGGVRKIHMIDGRMPHSLLLEIFTDAGVGTEIISDGKESSDY